MDGQSPFPILSIVSTVTSREQGLAMAREALSRRLAACVQVDSAPVTSIYRWQGVVCEDTEYRVTFKTSPVAEPALRALVASLHPHEVPQWVATPAAASPAYQAWVAGETVA
jgi:periplasmic divalent cation tolerance protein